MGLQWFIIKDVYVYQDNQTAILIENNGTKSMGEGTRYMKIKYFFVSDNIKDKELKVLWYPTEKMIGGFYTKPL